MSLSPGAARVLMIPRDGPRQKRGFLNSGTELAGLGMTIVMLV